MDLAETFIILSYCVGAILNFNSKMEIIKILRKNKPLFVKQIKVGELDKTKCSPKFLLYNLNDSVIVNVKCYEDGTLDLKCKKEEYRIIIPDNVL
jgi:hypothetical protein